MDLTRVKKTTPVQESGTFSTKMRRLKMRKKFDFLKSPVSRIVPKIVKGTFGIFLNIYFVAKYQKIEGVPFGDMEKNRRKSLTKPK